MSAMRITILQSSRSYSSSKRHVILTGGFAPKWNLPDASGITCASLQIAALCMVMFSLHATAADLPEPPTMASLGLQSRHVSISSPTAPYSADSTVLNAGFNRQFNAVTMGGLNLFSNLTNATTSADHKGNISGAGAGVSLARVIGPGRMLVGSLSYGKSALNSDNAGTHYDTAADTLGAGLGIVQYVSLGTHLTGSVGLNYSWSLSKLDSYRTSSGTQVNDSSLHGDTLGLSGSLAWRLGLWRPSLSLGINHASSEQSLSDTDSTAINYGVALGYDLGRGKTLSANFGATTGLKNVSDSRLGVSLVFPF